MLMVVGVALVGPAWWGASAAPPAIGGCQTFPADNVWNMRVETLPLEARSGAVFDLSDSAPRPATRTPADAAPPPCVPVATR